MNAKQLYEAGRLAEAIGEVTGILGEIFGAALAVKVAGAESRVVDHLTAINERRRLATLRDQVFSSLVRGVSFTSARNTGRARPRAGVLSTRSAATPRRNARAAVPGPSV